jgi:hypothetical protein
VRDADRNERHTGEDLGTKAVDKKQLCFPKRSGMGGKCSAKDWE